MNKKMPKPICVSIFKNGENIISQPAYTQKWVELINTIEKTKSAGFAHINDKQPLMCHNGTGNSLRYL